MIKRIFTYLPICFLIAAIIHLINFYYASWDVTFLLDAKQFSINFVYALVIGYANIFFFGVINHYLSWEEHPKKMLLLGIIGSVLISTLGFYLARLIHFRLILGYSFSEFIQLESKFNYVFSMFVAFIITLIYHLVYFYRALEESKKKRIITAKTPKRKRNKFTKKAIGSSLLVQQLECTFVFN